MAGKTRNLALCLGVLLGLFFGIIEMGRAGDSITWTGTPQNVWNVNPAQKNFETDDPTPAPTEFENGDTVYFTAGTPGTVNITYASQSDQTVSVSGMHVDGNYTFATSETGSIGSSTSATNLTITGGNVTFNVGLDFTGGATLGGSGTIVFNKAFEFDGAVAIGTDVELKIGMGDVGANATAFSGGGKLTFATTGGTYTMSSNNSFNGIVTVEDGTLQLASGASIAAAKSVNVSTDGKLELATDASVNTLNAVGKVDLDANTLTLKGTGLAAGDSLGSSSNTIEGIGGNLKLDAAHADNTFTINNGTTYSGETQITKGTLALGTSGGIEDSIRVVIGNDGTFDTSGGGAAIIQGLSGSGKVKLGDNNLSIQEQSGSQNNTFSGVISGTNGSATVGMTLTDSDSTFTVSGVNTYEAETEIVQGILKLKDSGSIASSTNVKIAGAGALDISETTSGATITKLTGAGDVKTGDSETSRKTLTLLSTDATYADSYIGSIKGTGNVAVGIAGGSSGDVTYWTPQGYTGSTDINEGSLTLRHSDAIAASSGVALAENTSMYLKKDSGDAAIDASIKDLSGNATSVIDLGENTLTVKGAGTFSGNIVNTGPDMGNLTLNSAGTLTLAGTNTYTGVTTITKGTLALSGAGKLSAATDMIMTKDAVFDVSAAAAGNNVVLKSLKSTGNDGTDYAKVKLGDTVDRTLTLKSGGAFDGVISGDKGSVVFDSGGGAQIYTLKNANTYSGTTTVEDGNTLELATSGSISNSSKVTLGSSSQIVVNKGAGTESEIKAIDSAYSSSNIKIGDQNTLTLKGAGGTGDGVSIGDFYGTIRDDSGAGNFKLDAVNKKDYFALNSTAQHTGKTEIASGVLKLANNVSINTSSEIVMGGDGTLDLSAQTTNHDINKELTTTAGQSSNIILGKNTLTLSHADTNFVGTINNGDSDNRGNLILDSNVSTAGDGAKVTLNGSNSTGAITIEDGGVLTLNNSEATAGSLTTDGITVNQYGTLKAAGAITGNVTINNDGVFAYSNGTESNPGALTIQGNFYADTGSTMDYSMGVKPGAGVTVTGTVGLHGDINLSSMSASGTYNLFNADGTITQDFQNVVSGSYSYKFIQDDVAGTLKVLLLQGGQNSLTWAGETGEWNDTAENWHSDLDGVNAAWSNMDGNVANFTNATTVAKQIAVTGQKHFDTLNFSGDGYVISGDALKFAGANVSSSNNTPTISVGSGMTATINSQLIGGDTTGANSSNNDKLKVAGGGVLALTNGSNSYTGGTTIVDGTTLQLDAAGAAGSGAVTLSNDYSKRNTLALNFNDTWNYQIIDTDTGAHRENSVWIMDGKYVTFGTSQNYNATTKVGVNATLDMSAAGDQAIGGLTGEAGSTLKLGGNRLDVTQAGAGETFSGRLEGTQSAQLVKNGTGYLHVANYDSTAFAGRVAATGGTLYLDADGAGNTQLRLANTGSAYTAGTVEITNHGKDIEISGGGYYGAVVANGGNVVLATSTSTELQNTKLRLGAYTTMQVDSAQSLGGLTLDGSTVYFSNNGVINLGSGAFHANGGRSTLVVDANAVADVSGKSFFDLLNTGKTYLITTTGGIGVADIANVDVVGANNASLLGGVSREITQSGSTNGRASFQGTSGGDGAGFYYGLTLTQIESYGGTPNVVIDSSPTANAGVASTFAYVPGTQLMNAKLTGVGGYDFTGNRSITLGDSATANDYYGTTTVNMANNTGVYADNDKAFGNTSLLDIRRGFVDLNTYDIEVGALSGAGGTQLRFGSGSTLAIDYRSNDPDGSTYSGNISGTGDIVKSGSGTQLLTGNNVLAGNIEVDGGTLVWAGRLVKNASSNSGNVGVDGGSTFVQRGSTIAGNVAVSGSKSVIQGYGSIGGDLIVTDNATYKVSADSGRLDSTSVAGKTTFGKGSGVEFTNKALSYMYMNPSASLGSIITSNGGFDLANSSWKDGVIKVDLGILGTANFAVSNNSLGYSSLDRPVKGVGDIIGGQWAAKGVRIGSVLNHSSLANAVGATVNKYLYDESWLPALDDNVNARFANAKFMGRVNVDNLKYSSRDVRSMFNYESGLTATQPVDAALDNIRTMIGQGVVNRVNSLRAARTILANAAGMPAGYGPVQSDLAYGSLTAGEGGYVNADGSVTPDTAVAAATYAPGYGYGYGQGYGYDYGNYRSARVWAGGIGHWSKYDTSSGGIAGYKYNAGGVMVGLDGSVGDFTFGGAFGFTRGDLEDKLALSSNSDIDSYSLNLYTDYNHESGVNTMFFGGAQLFDNDISRRVAGFRDDDGTLVADNGKEKSDYKGYGWYLGANVSYDFLPMDNLTVTPSVGLTYADVRSKSFTRRLRRDSGVVLTDKVGSVKKHSVSMPIDVTVTYDAMVKPDEKLSLMGNVGYAYEFNNKGAKGGLLWTDVDDAATIRFTGRDPGRNAWNFGVGARYQRGNIDFDVKYDYSTRKDQSAHRLGAAVGFEF